MEKLTFFRLLAEAAKYSPDTPGERWRSLQTFAVVRNMVEVNSDSLGKPPAYKGSPYFFSKRWAASGYPSSSVSFDYPALLAVDRVPAGVDLFSSHPSVESVIQLSVVYPNISKAGDAGLQQRCKQLLLEELYEGMKGLLMYAIRFMSKAVFASVDGGENEWYNRAYLDNQVSEGQITNYVVSWKETNAFRQRIKQANIEASGGYVDDEGKDALCGVSLAIRLPEAFCETNTHEFDIANCCTGY